ncbi:sn1-specific diacylglycerol lipase beta isoform X1 [Ipomoea triloba]|uniref:sn1-specific diacylglycerol lipase beta isoform X1 n=1 Tax=Ipomoea triloba TaxID=35885 RepID=UPI00125E1894|nr:sn1-specific diacylglycerol lipase beta isoform X1 [Ipomoea triloba]
MSLSKWMAIQSAKRFFNNIDTSIRLIRKQEPYQNIISNVLRRCQSHWSDKEKIGSDGIGGENEASKLPATPKSGITHLDSRSSNYDLDKYNFSSSKWKFDTVWLSKALESASQLCRWALPSGNGIGDRPPPINRSLAEIYASIQRSKLGLQDWSLSDLTIGLYLIYLQQASINPREDIKGELISSESVVHDLMYHTELAKGSYRDSTRGLARNCMLRETDVVKFIKISSMLRPGYYIAVDKRKRLVILGIRGTHTVYDIITDIVSSSNEEVTFEGYSTHFGSAEAARWFLTHEMETLRKCLQKHEGFRLRLVGHSLGGAIASLLAIMIRKKSPQELGFNPDIVTAVGIATPPCVSQDLAEKCSDYVVTVVMQDDIIPRLSVASLIRLRNEIIQTDWMSVFEKGDWKGVVDLFTNAKQVVSSIQDVAQKLAEFAKSRDQTTYPDVPPRKEVNTASGTQPTSGSASNIASLAKQHKGTLGGVDEELLVPGSVYYLKRNTDEATEFFTLWKRHPGEHFQRILLSSNVISDHRCDSHNYALRDVLKGIPASSDEAIFR